MKRDTRVSHQFVEYIPDELGDNIVYVSIPFATVAHKCCCGCGKEVVTPLSPTDWTLSFDGATISLDPSIGNWSFECESHYWITRNAVRWAPAWSREEVDAGRRHDRRQKKELSKHATPSEDASAPPGPMTDRPPRFWSRVRRWWR